jgi:diaminohydroxyphosphoribosylaminopyrimidine deaminase/5-amino-6-(5-phosphoribosylamino)uracil reductase
MDEVHLRRALLLAERAAALASPNPAVGCVLAHGDHIVGEGAHRYNHLDHAEIVALRQAALLGHDVHFATAYVTLEPCAHYGRTPPCANALINAGITRCVIATVDPNPLVRGQGIARLNRAGVAVALAGADSLAAQQARTLNDAFAFSIQHGRPFVTLKAALSADGYLAPPASERTAAEPHWITGPAARADVQQIRHASDAVLTGIGTVLADNPLLTDRTGLPRRRPLLRVILDPDLRTPPISAIVTSAAKDTVLFCRASAPNDREAALISAGAEVIRLESDSRSLDLNAILSTLAARKILSVLVEAGPALNTAFLSANLADKLVLYTGPTKLGVGALPFTTCIGSPRNLEAQLTHISRTSFPHGDSEDTRLTGYLHNPWNAISQY